MTTSQTAETPPPKNNANPHKRKIAIIMLSIIFLFIGLLWLLYWLIWGRFEEYTEDAYVNGNIVQLMSQVPGTVIQINTDDTRLVEEGEVIIKLDPADMEAALQKAAANLGATVRDVRRQFEAAQQAQSVLILRQADLMKAQLDLQRRTGLVGERAISREELQHYATAAQAAQAEYNSALHNLHSLLALVENSNLYNNPQVERAKANFKVAYLNLQRTTIVAPVTGYVAKRNVQVGQQVNLASPMLAIIPLNQIWVDANYKESQLGRLRVGQPVSLEADAYPDVAYKGKLLGLNAGTGAAFALLPAQNATGNWIKIVQRLPVRIGLDAEQIKKHPLQLGLSMRVNANTHQQKGTLLAPEAKQQQAFYATNVFANQLKHANAMIEHILRQNSPDMFLPVLNVPARKTA